MQKIAKFHKVSYSQFLKDWKDTFPATQEAQIQKVYEDIHLPKRATSGSAGYDFFTPIPIILQPQETIKLPTGIRVEMLEGWVLQLYPRSSLGFKYRLQFDNTVGIIDSDYFYSDNEGHMFTKLTNDANEHRVVKLQAQEAFIQGIFTPFGICYDDDVTKIRNGGIGSTNNA